MLPMNLSNAKIQALNYERYYYPCPHVQKRMHAVYIKAILGQSDELIGKIVGLHRHTVRYWINRYAEQGINALYESNYGTNKSQLEKYSADILKSFNEQPPRSVCEARSRIEKMTGIVRSPTQIRAFMKRHEMRYIKTGHIPAKADTERQKEWVETQLKPAIKMAKNKKCHLLFMDASHFILQPFICALWCTVRLFIKAASGRNRINVLGVVNAITKEVITMSNTTYINANTIIEFLEEIRKHYYDLPIKIVLDNARYQHCLLVTEAAKRLDITLLFLPPYSPNLNIIERLWKFTKKEILYAKYYDSPQKFHSAINSFFQTINLKHKEDLQNLLTLKFQFFENKNVLNYPV